MTSVSFLTPEIEGQIECTALRDTIFNKVNMVNVADHKKKTIHTLYMNYTLQQQ